MEVILEGQNFDHVGSHGDENIGFRIDALAYKDPSVQNIMDAAFFYLEPKGRTNVFELVDANSIFIDNPAGGKGTVIIQHPGLEPEFHDVEVKEIDEMGEAVAPKFTYSEPGTFFAYVADSVQGFGIFATELPPYFEGQERELDLDDPDVPLAFRDLMLKVINRNTSSNS